MSDIVVIVPHPDDESVLCAGLIARAVEKGAAVTIVFITSGAHGRTLGLVPQRGLTKARQKEARQACGALGAKNVLFLGYKDYDPRRRKIFNWAKAKEKLLSRLRISSKTLIVSFPPNGMNGHPDHVRGAALAKEIAEETGAALLYVTTPALHRSDRDPPSYMKAAARRKLFLPPTHVLRLAEGEMKQKLLALSFYRTQALSILDYMRYRGGNLFDEHYALAGRAGREVQAFLSRLLTRAKS